MKPFRRKGNIRRNHFHNLRDEYNALMEYERGNYKHNAKKIPGRYWVKKFDTMKMKEISKRPNEILTEFRQNGVNF